jgi:hypothetical protein
MKRGLAVKGVLALVVLAAFLVCGACGAGFPPGHWEQDGISLDWPQGWRLDPGRVMDSPLERQMELSVLCELGRSKPYGQLVLFAHDLLPGETLQNVFDQAYKALAVGLSNTLRRVTGWSTTVSGLPALVKSYSAASGEPMYAYRDVWVERDGRLYVLAGWGYVGSSEERIGPELDEIVRSLQMGGSQ